MVQIVLDTGTRARQLWAHPTFSEILLKGHETEAAGVKATLREKPKLTKQELTVPADKTPPHLRFLQTAPRPKSIMQPSLGRSI